MDMSMQVDKAPDGELHTVEPSTQDQEVKVEESDASMHVDEAPNRELLLCPPKALVECMFPDAFVFPASIFPSPVPSKHTVNHLFQQLCQHGLYSPAEGGWTTRANAPEFTAEHNNKTEENFATFLNTLVDATVNLIQAKSAETRIWSTQHGSTPMPGSMEPRTPGIFAMRRDIRIDWRSVDCIMVLKNGLESDNERDSVAQDAERARSLFYVQDDRRFAVLIRILRDRFNYTTYDRGGCITTGFLGINTHPLLFYHLILGISFCERRHLGYDTSVSGMGASRRLRLDLASDLHALRDLEIQLILHTTGRVNGCGTTVRLLKVTEEDVANSYGKGGDGYLSPPGLIPGQKDFGIVAKDTWEENWVDSGALSEGIILQLLHVKGVQGVTWCLDERPVIVPDAPPAPITLPPDTNPRHFLRPFFDTTLYIRSRWGIRQVHTTTYKEDRKVEGAGTDKSLSIGKKWFVLRTPVMAKARDIIVKAMGIGAVKDTEGKTKAKAKVDDNVAKGIGSPSATTSPTSLQGISLSNMPQVVEDEHDGAFVMRSQKFRSYLYPVGTPIYWFKSLLELLCVLSDVLRTHQQASSVKPMALAGVSYSILHCDPSIWNIMMVCQSRSDWPMEREWHSAELRRLWNDGNVYSKQLRRGLLIDWGFSALESSGSSEMPQELTEDDVKVFRPANTWDPRPQSFNVVPEEENTARHYTEQAETSHTKCDSCFSIPPLWSVDGDGGNEITMPTQGVLRCSKHGEVNVKWVNEALGKDSKQLSNATGTWPFVSLDIMVAWLRNQQLVIQDHHDLETLFMSFAAVSVWFAAPFHAKDIFHDQEGDLAWIFEHRDATDDQAVYRKWRLFGPDFDKKILQNLSSYFNCEAMKNLLRAMRDMCFPPTWSGKKGKEKDTSPSTYVWPQGKPRVTHEKMIAAVETAIATLLKDTSEAGIKRLTADEPDAEWKQFHADIDENGIFTPPTGMKPDVPPVVLHGVVHHQPLSADGIFDKILAIPMPIDTSMVSTLTDATSDDVSHPTTSRRAWDERVRLNLGRKRWYYDAETNDYCGPKYPRNNSKNPRLDGWLKVI